MTKESVLASVVAAARFLDVRAAMVPTNVEMVGNPGTNTSEDTY